MLKWRNKRLTVHRRKVASRDVLFCGMAPFLCARLGHRIGLLAKPTVVALMAIMHREVELLVVLVDLLPALAREAVLPPPA